MTYDEYCDRFGEAERDEFADLFEFDEEVEAMALASERPPPWVQ